MSKFSSLRTDFWINPFGYQLITYVLTCFVGMLSYIVCILSPPVGVWDLSAKHQEIYRSLFCCPKARGISGH